MTLAQLAEEYFAARPALVVSLEVTIEQAVIAAKFYAGYGDIASISGSDPLPGAGDELPDDMPAVGASLPIKRIELIDENTVVTTGEWSIIGPLFNLYVERAHATAVEASRSAGVEPWGRTLSELEQQIEVMQAETIPSKAFVEPMITVG